MKLHTRFLLATLLSISSSGVATAGDVVIPHDPIEVRHILKQFWLRVDEGKVGTGGKVFSRSALQPVAVVFEQPLASPVPGMPLEPVISVRATVLEQVLIPNMPDTEVVDVSVILSKQGEVLMVRPSLGEAKGK